MTASALVFLGFLSCTTGQRSDRRPGAEERAGSAGHDELRPTLEPIASLRLGGRLEHAMELVEKELARGGLRADEAVALHIELARIHDRLGLHHNTRPVAQALEAIEAAAAVEGVGPASRALVELAFADYHYRAEIPERTFTKARAHAERARSLFEEVGDAHGQADAVHKLGLMAFFERDLERARHLFDRSLELDRAGGARAWFCGEYERHVGFVDREEGDMESTLRRFRKSLDCRKEAGAVDASLFAAVSLGSALIADGQAAEAAEPLTYAVAIAEDIDSPVGAMRAHFALGRMYAALMKPSSARESYARALDLADRVGSTSTAEGARGELEALGAASTPAP